MPRRIDALQFGYTFLGSEDPRPRSSSEVAMTEHLPSPALLRSFRSLFTPAVPLCSAAIIRALFAGAFLVTLPVYVQRRGQLIHEACLRLASGTCCTPPEGVLGFRPGCLAIQRPSVSAT
ncbi:hypothetical protein DAEQUDRAFT_400988 [Daedalea quercina L-15889]|uniref:Uncharacterized protein n=1 Tax=Daedalea quercina L-15889 TaxID=1314783 RepID=A0A165NQI4_9APHY|nr:hypothetical protein DAEQUDRAFT_400988 [Daedalea quercina L-15889]